MTHRTISGGRTSRCDSVSIAIRIVAEIRTPLDNFRLPCRRPLGITTAAFHIGRKPVAAPFPYIAGHFSDPIWIRRV